MTGPATDNDVGRSYIRASLGLPAHNARRDADGLLAVVRDSLDTWLGAREAGAVSVAG